MAALRLPAGLKLLRRLVPPPTRPLASQYDYIIVGAGTAGCVLANRLSTDPNVSVLLLEAGGKDDYIWTKIPVGYLYCIGNPKVDWGFKTEPEPGLNGRAIDYPRGKVLGGCSSINGMIYMRGQARDYDHWAQLGNPGWSWDDVLPYFLKSEDNLALEPNDLHARGGEWRIEKPRISWDILDAFMEAAVQAGLPKVDDFNSGNNEGVGYFHVNQKRGWRWNTSRGFLKPIENRPNLRIVTGAHTKKVTIKDAKATGIVFDLNGVEQSVGTSGEVILAAGPSHLRQSCSYPVLVLPRRYGSTVFPLNTICPVLAVIYRTTCRSAALSRSRVSKP